VGVNCHHKAALLKAWVLSADFSVPVTVSHEPVILGSGGGIGGFREFLAGEEYFIVHNGDMLSSIDIGAAQEAYLRDMPLCGMVLHDAPGFNNVSIDENGGISDMRDILRPPGVARRLAYSGICFLRADIFRYIPPGESDLILLLIEIMKKGSEKIQALMAGHCVWRDVGTPASYLAAHRDILIDRQPLVSRACMPGSALYAGGATCLAEGVECAGFVSIGDRCRIGSSCRLENSVVWDGTELPAGTAVKNSIIGPGWSVRVQEAL
jgi:NDP-sugar pyrophosphorylase family protein